MKRTDKAKIEKQIEDFNTTFKIGDDVLVHLDGRSELFPTKTRSEAYEMCEAPVVFLENVSGCYHIRCVSKP